MITENLSTLKIHKLSQAQYDRELANGSLDPNALYLTPDEEVDLSGLATKDELAAKADANHNHDDRYYTETEIDTKISNINTSINKITSGTTVVKKAEHATSADTATEANHATSADTATSAASATKATQDGNGKVISSTYETKTDASAKLTEAKTYTDTKTNGMATTTVVDNKISAHNSSATAHSDIRDLINALTTKVNNFLDVDDTTTDQLSEVLELIDNNKGTLESLTSGKVNVSDIVNNLTTANANKVLSANQGVVLKGLIDALQTAVDGKAASSHSHAISEVTNLQSTLNAKASQADLEALEDIVDGKASTTHSHAISDVTNLQSALNAKAAQTSLDSHTGNTTVHITSTERTNWNAAKTHADSAHAPSNAQANVIESIKVNGTAQTITSKSVNITVPTTPSEVGAAPVSHTHAISDITNLQTTLNNASSAISANTSSISALTDRTAALEGKVGDGFEEITSQEIQNLFSN